MKRYDRNIVELHAPTHRLLMKGKRRVEKDLHSTAVKEENVTLLTNSSYLSHN